MAIDKEFRGAEFPMVENSMFYQTDEIDDVRLIRTSHCFRWDAGT